MWTSPLFDELLDSLDQIQAEHDAQVALSNPPAKDDPLKSVSQPSQPVARPSSRLSSTSTSKQGDLKQFRRQSTTIPSRPASPQMAGEAGGAAVSCAKCGYSLYGNEYVSAGGKAYHKEHFTCVKCRTELIGTYYNHHSQTYCQDCAAELLPCTTCRKGITGQYMIQEGKPFHLGCMERKHCAKCGEKIDDTILTALGKPWHVRCFTCITCLKELGAQFIAKDGHGQCNSCATKTRPTCEKCRIPLIGEYMAFEGNSFHPECFLCSQCRNRLGTSGFYNVSGQLKCKVCSGR